MMYLVALTILGIGAIIFGCGWYSTYNGSLTTAKEKALLVGLVLLALGLVALGFAFHWAAGAFAIALVATGYYKLFM